MSAGSLENYEIALNLSCFIGIIPQPLWQSLIWLLENPNTPHNLFIKVLRRVHYALVVEHHTPNL
jgi:hypothetical protein